MVQRLGTGLAFRAVPITTAAVASGVTAIMLTTITVPIKDTDVLRVYIVGLAGDTTTPDIITQIWEDEAVPFIAGTGYVGDTSFVLPSSPSPSMWPPSTPALRRILTAANSHPQLTLFGRSRPPLTLRPHTRLQYSPTLELPPPGQADTITQESVGQGTDSPSLCLPGSVDRPTLKRESGLS